MEFHEKYRGNNRIRIDEHQNISPALACSRISCLRDSLVGLMYYLRAELTCDSSSRVCASVVNYDYLSDRVRLLTQELGRICKTPESLCKVQLLVVRRHDHRIAQGA